MTLSIKLIAAVVCKYYDVELYSVKSTSRKEALVKARQVIFYLCRKYSNLSLVAIGDYFDKDHATVIHSVNKIANEIRLYADIRQEIKEIEDELVTPPIVVKDIDLLAITRNYSNSFITI